MNLDEVKGDFRCLVCTKNTECNIESLRSKLITYIRGKTNIKCAKHYLPLKSSDTKERICTCGKKEYICCPELNCQTRLCKLCMANTTMDEDVFLLVQIKT